MHKSISNIIQKYLHNNINNVHILLIFHIYNLVPLCIYTVPYMPSSSEVKSFMAFQEDFHRVAIHREIVHATAI